MSKIKILLASAFVAAATATASAQTSSPYSMYGYGIIGDRATSLQKQMGGVGYAMNSGRQINVMNPASYAAIDSLTFLFDLGADVSMLWSQEGAHVSILPEVAWIMSQCSSLFRNLWVGP